MIWDEVISMLSLRLNKIQLKNWIQPLVPLYMEEELFVLDSTSSFISSMVRKNYQEKIEQCLTYICQKPVHISMVDPSSAQYEMFLTRAKAYQKQAQKEEGKKEEGFISGDESFQKEDLKKEKKNQDPLAEKKDGQEKSLKESGDQKEISSLPAFSKPEKEGESIAKKLEEKNQRLKNLQEKNGYNTLNHKYTIENFVRGPSNDFAYAAARAVMSHPGTLYNPLFIYGLSGLGKTHLMQAVAHEILRNDPQKKILYITSENFMNEMIATIEDGSNKEKESFRKKYRSIDVLLIDDIQFIAGKKATMEEIFHTFNDLKEANKQIILSADKPPKELKNLEERLVTRFEGGMTVDIQAPDFETRVAILNHKMKDESILLPSYVVDYIAENVTENIRELEGALLKVIAYFHFRSRTIDPKALDENMALAREALKLEEENAPVITVEDIMTVITKYYQLDPADLTSKTRTSSIAFPRQVAMYEARKLTNLSLVAIGRSFFRDHTTVMHAVDKVSEKIAEDSQVKSDLEAIEKEIKHRG